MGNLVEPLEDYCYHSWGFNPRITTTLDPTRKALKKNLKKTSLIPSNLTACLYEFQHSLRKYYKTQHKTYNTIKLQCLDSNLKIFRCAKSPQKNLKQEKNKYPEMTKHDETNRRHCLGAAANISRRSRKQRKIRPWGGEKWMLKSQMKNMELQLQHQSFQWIFRTDFR